MSYQEEYYKLIENQTFYQLPEQSLINYDERLALAIFKNYKNRRTNEEYESYNRYKEINFTEILNFYKNNKKFWEKANIQDQLLNEDFRQQFPEICFQFLTDKEFLLNFFANKKNVLILDSLNSLVPQEEFERLEKSFLLSSYGHIEKIIKYEDDEDFIKEIVKNCPSIFKDLSDKSKNNKNIILVYLEYEQSILTFNKQKQNELFITWAKIHRNWDMKIIDQLDFEYLKPIMKKINKSNNEYLIQKLLSRNIKKYKEVILDFFEQNKNHNVFFKMIKEKSLEDLSPILNNMDCTIFLENWINNYSYKIGDNFDIKILQILKNYKTLNEKWENSFEYDLMNKINNNEALTFELLRRTLDVEMLKLNENKISYEKLEKNILQLKKYLPIEVLKERRIPNNHIIEFLQHIKLTEKFQPKEIKDKKIKI